VRRPTRARRHAVDVRTSAADSPRRRHKPVIVGVLPTEPSQRRRWRALEGGDAHVWACSPVTAAPERSSAADLGPGAAPRPARITLLIASATSSMAP
jgi:hypothetical protein